VGHLAAKLSRRSGFNRSNQSRLRSDGIYRFNLIFESRLTTKEQKIGESFRLGKAPVAGFVGILGRHTERRKRRATGAILCCSVQAEEDAPA
jgi:hypothetical protein